METEALEAQLYANPDDRDTMLVYADHLARAGDPRGHLIAVCARLAADAEDAVARAELAALCATTDLFGPLGALHRHKRILAHPGKHRFGYVRRLRVNLDEVDAARLVALLEHPAARFATELELVGDELAWAVDLVVALGRPRGLRALVVSSAPVDAAALYARFPYLLAIEVG